MQAQMGEVSIAIETLRKNQKMLEIKTVEEK
jgi:hypothetical protein